MEEAMAREADGFQDFEDEDDAWEHAMVRSLDREEQFGGALGPLFRFRMEPAGRRRRWRDTVDHAQFHAVLEQGREARTGDDLGVHLMEALYTAIRRQIAVDARPQDLLHFAIQAHGFAHAFRSSNIQVEEFLRRDTYIDELLDTLAGKLNSNEDFHPDRGLQIDVVLVRMPTPGSGRGRKREVGFRAWQVNSKTKQSIISIKNRDQLCCARAIVTMRAHCHRNDPGVMPWNEWKNLRDGRPRQKTRAQELHRAAGVPEGPCGLAELDKFQQYLTPHYQLKVISRQKPFFIIFRGPEAPNIIRLLKSGDHFKGCTSFKGFTNRSYWCDLCDKGYDHNNAAEHPCEGRTCRACHRNNTCPDYDRFSTPCLPCTRCHFKFYGQNCLAYHQASKECGKKKKCLTCFAGYKVDPKHPHRCYEEECYSCGQYVKIATHKCYIQPPFEPPPPQQRNTNGETTADEVPPPKLMYADIECMLTEVRGFIPNLLCYRGEWQSTITTIQGEGCVDTFLNHLDDYAHPADDNTIEEQPLIILFHNLKGFDGIFILNSLYKAMRTVEEQLTIGAKVLSFKSGALVFKDSLCFLPMPLSSFPATFGLTELKKGFFPHAFNTADHQDYRGPIPDLSYYDPDGMSPSKKAELETWHADQVRRNVIFDFQVELEEYCKSDVDILQGGCEKFCEEFQRKAGFNPFADCATIASACNRYWRKHHLEEDTIAVEPPQGWRGARVNQSWAALQWLAYQESQLPNSGVPRIKHVRNGGEQKVRTEKGEEFVDGLDESTNPQTVYEFLGCLWHGCPTCCKQQRHRYYGANPDRTLDELYEATEAKMQRLQRAGFQLKVQWECAWDKEVKSHPSIQSFLSTMTTTPPLQPRDAFFGGRTGAVSLHHKADVGLGEKIFYVDVTSLYPWVNKTARYPLGHPTIHYEPDNQDLDSYFGIALVTIRPPRGLYHPVLPVRHGGKLTFPLCLACVQKEQPKPLHERSAECSHSDQERQLQGTWCTPEIQEARATGYILVRIHEVWHFKKSKTGLFKDYVNTWLKIKQESAGWPRWCETREQQQQYIRRYREKEGITLENVAKNPERKQVAKLMLSFWGKFGERTNKSKVEPVKQPSQLCRLLTDSANDIQTIRICTEEVLEVVYKQTDDNDLPSAKTNIFIAAFTTCWARLKLYSYLHQLQEQVLYYDTDSVIYKWKPDQPKIATGDFLGEMTDELDGDYIKVFVSGGAKNYGYKTARGKVECKVRGFTLNVRGREKLNFKTMKAHILTTLKSLQSMEDEDEDDNHIAVEYPNHFHRDQILKKLKMTALTKKYRMVFDKRVIDRNTKRSHPFGYF